MIIADDEDARGGSDTQRGWPEKRNAAGGAAVQQLYAHEHDDDAR